MEGKAICALTLRDLDPATLLSDVPTALCGEFANIRQGLHVFLFENESDLDVYDRNTTPKIVVHRQGVSLKPGKSEQTFIFRMRSYNDHMHRRPPGRGSEWVLRECLKSGYLLDLSWATSGLDAPARIFERYWTEAVNAYLKTHQLLAKPPIRQLRRAEWRYLEPGQWTETIKNGFRDYLGQVAERILGMIRIASFP